MLVLRFTTNRAIFTGRPVNYKKLTFEEFLS